jgi:ubiquitin-protein ligase
LADAFKPGARISQSREGKEMAEEEKAKASKGNRNRLESDYADLKTYFANDPDIDIQGVGPAPYSKYMIVYRVPSLRLTSQNVPRIVTQTVVEISLPAIYPKVAPVARTVAGDVVFHPNFNANKICLTDEWSPAIKLVDLVLEISDLLQWRKFNVHDPLNAEAVRWSEAHKHELPLAHNGKRS